MKKNLYITLANGQLIIIPNVQPGQLRAVRPALETIYEGATFAEVDSKVKPQRLNVNTVLANAGYNKFGDFVGKGEVVLDPADAVEPGDEDEDDTQEVQAGSETGDDVVVPAAPEAPVAPALAFQPTTRRSNVKRGNRPAASALE